MIGNNKSGFTLIELIISIAIFSFVLTAVTGIFFLSLKAQRQAVIEKETSENVRFALEFMSRSMRFAQRYDGSLPLPAGCLSNGVSFSIPSPGEIQFINIDNICVKFTLSANEIVYWGDVIGSPGVVSNLTFSSSATIDSLEFIIMGENKSDFQQPRVTIIVSASGAGSAPEAQGVKINIQTTVTSRNLDVP